MKMLQALGKDTKYEHRNLIGYLDGLKGFHHKELEDFYNQWYRPDYQAVVVWVTSTSTPSKTSSKR